MADSSITKKALASALVNLMQTKDFQKISVAEICGKCNMNRKSFYYHFKDKYDLMNWVFDTQLREKTRNFRFASDWELMLRVADCVYENRRFYAKALAVHGQNSLNEHIRELAEPGIYEKLREIMPGDRITSFHVNFFTDALLAAFYRWVCDDNCIPPEEFLDMLKCCMVFSGRSAERMRPEPGYMQAF